MRARGPRMYLPQENSLEENPLEDNSEISFEKVNQDSQRFKSPNTLWYRRLTHTYSENKYSGTFIGVALAMGYGLFIVSGPSGPAAPFCLAGSALCYASAGIAAARVVVKNHNKYRQRIREFGPQEALGLNEEVLNSVYRSNGEYEAHLNKTIGSIFNSVPVGTEPSVEEMIQKINYAFTAERHATVSEYTYDKFFVRPMNRVFGTHFKESVSPLDSSQRLVADAMKARLGHIKDGYYDQIEDLSVIQFHSLNYFMGFLQKCLDEKDAVPPPTWLPRLPENFNAQWVNDMQVKHEVFVKDFLETFYTKNSDTGGLIEDISVENFRERCREPIQKIGEFIRAGKLPDDLTDDRPANNTLANAFVVETYLNQALSEVGVDTVTTNRDQAGSNSRLERQGSIELQVTGGDDAVFTPSTAVRASSNGPNIKRFHEPASSPQISIS